MKRKAKKPVDRRRYRISRQAWLSLGARLYGEDPREWKFRCVRCGSVQSHESVRSAGPGWAPAPTSTRSLGFEGDTSNWIYFSCAGRQVPGVGCDWTLGGLFPIHHLSVADDGDNGRVVPIFEFADIPDGYDYATEGGVDLNAARAAVAVSP